MTNDNLRIWDAVSKTDPKHTKGFKRSGGFQGTAIKPIWMTKRMTEQFGPAGTGWGMTEPSFETVNAGEEILVFCTVAIWYGDTDHRVYGVGGDKVLGKNKYGPFTNDEAFKASYTDALSNAMKQIGLGADIHMGMFEDEKYVRATEREYANGTANGHADAPSIPDEDRALLKNPDDSRSQYEVDKRKTAETFAYKALEVFGAMAGPTDIAQWYSTPISPKGRSTNRDAVTRLKENFPDIANKIETAADEVRLRNGARMQ